MRALPSLVGTYSLKSHGVISKEGAYKPTSPYAKGDLRYSADGNLSVLILFAENPTVAKDVFAYTGTYQVLSDKLVEHKFAIASVPRIIGTTETRDFSVNGNELKLGRVFEDGTSFEAIWVKN
jgi:hypothetical protein